ncbi:adhesin [Georgenia ruanii]|nr:adhesin [Georgenia ruanii]MPV88145.1 adhesin [Georgenia ruanii]
MLTLTPNAQAAVRDLSTQAGLPETGGMRIALTEPGDGVELSLVPAPDPADDVIEGDDGARVFVEEATTELLTAHELDAAQTPEGTGFTLRAQA